MNLASNKSNSKNNVDLEIRLAIIDDATGITKILEKNLMSNKKNNENTLEQNGFLIHQYTSETIKSWITDKENHIVLVARKNNKLVGYLIACDIKEVELKTRSQFIATMTNKDNLSTDNVLYHKQIAVNPGEKGIGSKLLLALFDEAIQKGYSHIICLIVDKPHQNKISITFHEKYGFKFIGLMDEDKITERVYLKQII